MKYSVSALFMSLLIGLSLVVISACSKSPMAPTTNDNDTTYIGGEWIVRCDEKPEISMTATIKDSALAFRTHIYMMVNGQKTKIYGWYFTNQRVDPQGQGRLYNSLSFEKDHYRMLVSSEVSGGWKGLVRKYLGDCSNLGPAPLAQPYETYTFHFSTP